MKMNVLLRQVLCFVLALTLVFSMFGASVPVGYAETTQCIDGCTEETHAEGCPNAETEELEDTTNDGNTEEPEASEVSCTRTDPHLFATEPNGDGHFHEDSISIGSGFPRVFRFGTAEESTVVLFSALDRTGYVAIESAEHEENGVVYYNVVSLGVSGVGGGSITYTVDGVTYSYPITGTLRTYACYTAPERIADNYTDTFFAGEDGSVTLYILWDENAPAPTAVEALSYSDGTGKTEEQATSIETDGYQEIFGEKYIQLTFPVPTDEMVLLKLTHNGQTVEYIYLRYGGDGGSGGEGGEGGEGGISCTETEPHLFTTWPDGSDHMHETTLGIDSGSPLIFYLGTTEASEVVPFKELKITGIATISQNTDITDSNGELIPNVVNVGLSGLGEGSITYTVDGKTYTYAVTGTLRPYACYTAPERTAQKYTSNFNADENGLVTLYILWDEDCTAPTKVTALNHDGDESNAIAYTVNTEYVAATESTQAYIKVTFSVPELSTLNLKLTNGDEHLDTIWLNNGSMGGGEGGEGGISCTETEPHLFTTNEWDDGHSHEQHFSMDSGAPVFFRFGTVENSVIVPFDKLEPKGNVSINENTYWTDENGDTISGLVDLHIPGVGEGSIIYTVGDTSYIYTVTGSLRNYACYTAPERTAENYTGYFVSDAEEDITLYIMWDKDCTAPTAVTAQIHKGDENAASDYTVNTEFVEATESAEAYIKVTFSVPELPNLNLKLMDGDQELDTIGLWANYGGDGGGMNDNLTVTLDHEGTPITVGIGVYAGDMMSICRGSLGASYSPDYPGGDFAFQIYFAAIANCDDQLYEATAPESFFSAVSNVNFYVKEWTNTDGSDPNICNAYFTEITKGQHANATTWMTTLQTQGQKFFTSTIAMQFTYMEQTYEVTCGAFYQLSGNIELDASDLDTAAKLNAVLQNSDTLMAWFEATYPTQYASYAGNGDTITLRLPAVVYDDVIVACGSRLKDSEREKPYYGLALLGSFDPDSGLRTTLPGLLVKGNVAGVNNLDFVAQSGKTMTYGGESFTCGILVDTSGVVGFDGWVDPEVCWISDCSFRGFKYGLRSTKDGFTGSTMGCEFIGNDFGVYIDSQNGLGGGNTTYTNNNFINNGCAVAIKSMPNGTTAYRLRFTDSNFIHNALDFFVPIPARFYFYRNWYGYYPILPYTTETDYSSLTAESRSAQIDDSSDTATVVSNPRRINQDYSSELGIDNAEGLHSVILNDEADKLLVSGQALEELVGTAEIEVWKDAASEEELGRWTFEGGE